MALTPSIISILTGQAEEHLISKPYPPNIHCPIHKDVVKPFLELYDHAGQDGYQIKIVSGYRSFARQLLIWNEKATGKRPVLDSNGNAMDPTKLSNSELMFAILHWTALPGASRHHWGTELDIIDQAAITDDYRVQLTQQEVEPGGIFAALHTWLDKHIQETDFTRPYWGDTYAQTGKGIAREKWHLSYAPLAKQFEDAQSISTLHNQLQTTQIELKEEILAHLDEIFEFFVRVSNK